METHQKTPILFLAFNKSMSNAKNFLTRERIKIEDVLEERERKGIFQVLVEPEGNHKDVLKILRDEEFQKRIFGFHYSTSRECKNQKSVSRESDYLFENDEIVKELGQLKGLRFVFVNGCRSEETAYKLIKAGVPVVIIVSSKIRRIDATDFAEAFYKFLGGDYNLNFAYEDAEIKVFSYWGGRELFKDKYWESAQDIEEYDYDESEVYKQLPWKIFINDEELLRKKWKEIKFQPETTNQSNESSLIAFYFTAGMVLVFGLGAIFLGLWIMLSNRNDSMDIYGPIILIGIFLVFLASILIVNTRKKQKKQKEEKSLEPVM